MKTTLGNNFFRWLPWIIIAIGFILRLDQYLFNRSLWLDEAFFVANVVDRSFLELFQAPLEYTGHIMPPGFLVMAKLAITWFGNSDFILRLFPFLSGIVSLFLFYFLAKTYVSAPAVLLALFFFAVSDPLIYYSSEFKQYSSDVTITIILLLLAAYIKTHPITFTRLFILAIAGIIAIWFSHPSVFILATIGIYLAFPYLINRQWQMVVKFIAVYSIWLLNFAVLYFFFINIDTLATPWLHQFWTMENAFMPSPFSIEGIRWLYHTFFMILEYPGTLENIQLAGGIIIIGCIALFFDKKGTLFFLIFPVLIALSASIFQKYAFSGRLILFLMPSLYLILAEGLTRIQIRYFNFSNSFRHTIVLTIILTALVAGHPTYNALKHLFNPRVALEEIKPVLKSVQDRFQTQDLIYLYYWAEPAFRYYASFYNFNYDNCHLINPIPENEYIKEVDYFRIKRQVKPVEVSDTQCILGVSEIFHQSKLDLDKLSGQGRVWFIFSHILPHEMNLFLNHLDTIGERLEENLQPGASAYLYKL